MSNWQEYFGINIDKAAKPGVRVTTQYNRDWHGRFASSGISGRSTPQHKHGNESLDMGDFAHTNKEVVRSTPRGRSPEVGIHAINVHQAKQEHRVRAALSALGGHASMRELAAATAHITRAEPTAEHNIAVGKAVNRLIRDGHMTMSRVEIPNPKNIEKPIVTYEFQSKGGHPDDAKPYLPHTVDPKRPLRFAPTEHEQPILASAKEWQDARREKYPGNRSTISGRQDARAIAGTPVPPERTGKEYGPKRNRFGKIVDVNGKPITIDKTVGVWEDGKRKLGADGKPLTEVKPRPATAADIKDSIKAKLHDIENPNGPKKFDPSKHHDVAMVTDTPLRHHIFNVSEKGGPINVSHTDAAGHTNAHTHVELDARSSVNGITSHLLGNELGLRKSNLIVDGKTVLPDHAKPGGLLSHFYKDGKVDSDASKPYYDTLSRPEHVPAKYDKIARNLTPEDFKGLPEGKDGLAVIKKAAKSIFTPGSYGGREGFAKIDGVGGHEGDSYAGGYIKGAAKHLQDGGMSSRDSIATARVMSANFQGSPINEFKVKISAIMQSMPPNFVWTNPLSGQPVAMQQYHTQRVRHSITDQNGDVHTVDSETPGHLNMRSSKAAAIPNFVHSIDAAHMAYLSKKTGSVDTIHDAIIIPHNGDKAKTQRELNKHVAEAYNAMNHPVKYHDTKTGKTHNYRGPVADLANQMKTHWQRMVGHTYPTLGRSEATQHDAHGNVIARMQNVKQNVVTQAYADRMMYNIDTATHAFFENNNARSIDPLSNLHFEE